MNRPLFALRDDKANLFNPPFTCSNAQVAIRQFGDVVGDNSKPSIITMHPADFSLHYLGEFDDETGKLHRCEGGTDILARGSDFVGSVDAETDAKIKAITKDK